MLSCFTPVYPHLHKTNRQEQTVGARVVQRFVTSHFIQRSICHTSCCTCQDLLSSLFCKNKLQGEACHCSWPLMATAPVFGHPSWRLWLLMACFPERIAELKNNFLPRIPDFVCLLSLSSFSQVYILPLHFHKVSPVWLSFKVAGKEVMKTGVVNCCQGSFLLKLTFKGCYLWLSCSLNNSCDGQYPCTWWQIRLYLTERKRKTLFQATAVNDTLSLANKY